MRGFSLVRFSVDHPRWVVAVTVVVSLAAMAALPRARTDTNPKNMLPATSQVRVSNDAVEKTFGLYEDMIVVGISHDGGVLNRETLARIQRITASILTIPGVAARDVAGFSTIDNVTVEEGTLHVGPLMTEVPRDAGELAALRKQLFDNPAFVGRIISQLLEYQTLKLSLFAAYSPTDVDYFVQPEIAYKATDALSVALGGNVFGGREETTFFGQLARNDNVYCNGRFDF